MRAVIHSYVACKLADGGTAVLKISDDNGRAPLTVSLSKISPGHVSHTFSHTSSRDGQSILTMVSVKNDGAALGLEVLQVNQGLSDCHDLNTAFSHRPSVQVDANHALPMCTGGCERKQWRMGTQ